MDTGSLSRGVKWKKRGFNHPSLSSAEVKERVKLYLYPLCTFLAYSRVKFAFFRVVNTNTTVVCDVRRVGW
jgi:hypothetical protein